MGGSMTLGRCRRWRLEGGLFGWSTRKTPQLTKGSECGYMSRVLQYFLSAIMSSETMLAVFAGLK